MDEWPYDNKDVASSKTKRKIKELEARAADIPNFNPDCNPSFSRAFKNETAPDELRQMLQVRGIGVVVIRSNRTTHAITMSIITKEEIGPCPDL